MSDGSTLDGLTLDGFALDVPPVDGSLLDDGSNNKSSSSSRLLIDASMISTDSFMSNNGGGSLRGGGGGVSEMSESKLTLDTEVGSAGALDLGVPPSDSSAGGKSRGGTFTSNIGGGMGDRMSSILELPLEVGLGKGLGRLSESIGLIALGSGISMSGNEMSSPKSGKTNALDDDEPGICAGGDELGRGGGSDPSLNVGEMNRGKS